MKHEELLAEYERMRARMLQLEAENQRLREQLKEAQLLIAQLRRELFGPKADRLTAEQEEQLKALNEDLEEEAQRPAPAISQVLEREDRAERRRKQHRRGRHIALGAEYELTQTGIIFVSFIDDVQLRNGSRL